MYFVVIPKVNIIVILMTYVRYLYSINCPTVICFPACCYLSYGETPLVNCGPRSNFLYIALPFTITHSVYFTCITITFYHSIHSILCSQQTGEIDNLIEVGSKVLGCVMCRFHVAARSRSSYINYAPAFSGAIVRSVVKLASITFWSLAFSYWFDNLGFTTEGNFLLCSSYLPLGVPNWVP
jgi:hypothetical protein